MKSRMLIALPLAAALMAPAFAQQDTSNQPTQNPPAATESAPTATAPAQPATTDQARQPLQAERHEGFWGKLNPFARKKYVQRQMEPIRGRVNELDELTAANSKAIKDVDSRATEGIRLAAARANEADQHAIQAGSTAQQAQQTASQANTRLQTVSQVVSSIDQYQAATQTEIRLRPGQIILSKKAKDALDQMATTVNGQNGYIFEVQGFSPGRGQAAIENSQRMAESVVRYLVLNHEVPVYRIYLLGMGNAPVPASTEGTRARRTTRGGRVEITLLKNGVDQLAKATAPEANVPESQGGMSGATAQPATTQPATAQPAPAQQLSPNQQPSSSTNRPATQQQQATPPQQ